MSAASPVIEVERLNVTYGDFAAVRDLTFQVRSGELYALLGTNGAGKTSTMRAISGVRGLTSGTITFDGEDVTKLRADQRMRKGLCLTPEGRGVFPGMTVTENLDMGAYTRRDKSGIAEDFDRVFGLFPRLKERRKQIGGTMSGGEQQMLAIGRSLMSRPKLLLLDEPSMGLAPMLIQQIFNIISEIAEQGTTILVVEQNAKQALSRADRAYVLETGKIVKTGTGAALLDDPSVREAYLGVA